MGPLSITQSFTLPIRFDSKMIAVITFFLLRLLDFAIVMMLLRFVCGFLYDTYTYKYNGSVYTNDSVLICTVRSAKLISTISSILVFSKNK